MVAQKETFTNVLGAARICGVSKDTIRTWSRKGKLPYFTINERGDRRFYIKDLYQVMGLDTLERACATPTRVALYLRVSGSTGQDSSLKAQEDQLREAANEQRVHGTVISVYKDKASGLNQNRPGLTKLLKGAKNKEFDVVYVTHADRLARFGVKYLEELLASYQVDLVVLYPDAKVDSQEELIQDFVSLVACFSGRIYGQRNAQSRKRLLAKATDAEVFTQGASKDGDLLCMD